MSSLTLFWIGIGILFLIIEMLTVTFYGLAIAIAAFVTAIIVWWTGAGEISILQGVVFALTSVLVSYFLPKLLTPDVPSIPQGLDIYIGEQRKLKKVGEDYKVTLDGVEYIVEVDDAKVGDKVEIKKRKGSIFYADKV